MRGFELCTFAFVISLAAACGGSGSGGGPPGGTGGASKGGASSGGKGGSGGATGGSGGAIGGSGGAFGGSGGASGGSGGASGGSGGTVGGAGGALGGSGGQGGSGGITDAGTGGATGNCASIASKTVAALTSDEIKLLCDCVAAIFGGYGKSVVCDGGTSVTAKASQQECVNSYKPLTCATAGEALQCSQDMAGCNLSSATCTKYMACALGDGG